MTDPEEYMEIKADVFRVIRANQERSAKAIMREIREQLPDVEDCVIKQCISELSELFDH